MPQADPGDHQDGLGWGPVKHQQRGVRRRLLAVVRARQQVRPNKQKLCRVADIFYLNVDPDPTFYFDGFES